MTEQHLIIIAGMVGGIIGGMGMGGGTLLIPLLTLCVGIEQHLAQSINLISFIPMAVIAIGIHAKNGYVRFKKALPVIVLAIIGAIVGSFLVRYASGNWLRTAFGVFLIVLGTVGIFKLIKTKIVEIKTKNDDVKKGGATEG